MFTVRFKDDPGWLEFSQPRDVVRAPAREAWPDAFARIERELDDGGWIAGMISYDGRLALGIFDAPRRCRDFETAACAVSPLLRTVDAQTYRRSVAAIQDAIHDGEVYQVNYTVPFALAIDGDPFSLWYSLARETDARYQAYLEDCDRRILSWSPELFLQIDGTRVVTKPMKGTSPPRDTSALGGEKNRAEHVMIVDLLRNDLRRFCERVDVRALCTIERYPTFATMTSTIEGTMRDGVPLATMFDAAFPCGSITGAPKRAAMEQIAAIEPQSRSAYCGTMGFLSPERRGWWNVAIRTAQLGPGGGRFDAGGGIVSDSDAEDEWNEIRIKSAFLRARATEFELWESFAGDASHEVLDAHLARLEESASRLDIAVDMARLRMQAVEALVPGTLVRLRLALDGTATFHRDLLASSTEPVAIRIAPARVRGGDPWLRIKSSWRPAHRAAWAFAQEHGCFDALLTNECGEITEGSRTNVFVLIDGALYTPPLSCGLLPGILRSRILAEGRAHERVLRAGDLLRASALYVGNSARGLLRARLQHQ